MDNKSVMLGLAMLDLWLPSYAKSYTTPWQVTNYTAL